ncbi:MAG: DUF4190 domain-containing protein [Armatimonadetes bacterium]|nr:DUF4190 domain-containing protein [Armatimonadota bacterium]
MVCRNCGSDNPNTNFFCHSCKRILQPALPESAQERMESDPAMRFLLPVGRSGLAIAAGYAGLFAVTLILAPVALILGILALRDLRRHPDKIGKGRATFGLVMGLLGSVFLALLIIYG